MLNLPNELRCMIISYLCVPSFCMLKKVCKWFSQDTLWAIYLKSIHTNSKCLGDSESSAKDKIKYMYEARDVLSDTFYPDTHTYTLSEVNSYELRYNDSIPIATKWYIIEISKYDGFYMFNLNIPPRFN